MARPPAPLRQLILDLLPRHPRDLVRVVAMQAGVSRPTVSAHIRKLESEGLLVSSGRTRKEYRPAGQHNRTFARKLIEQLDESRLWDTEVRPWAKDLPGNVLQILEYGFTEIVNNAKDHSEGRWLLCDVLITPKQALLSIRDDGEGIFKRIHRLCNLADERLALLELAKGKLTTDPERHSGEGIFFTSRACDFFSIASGGLHYERGPHRNHFQEWPEPQALQAGTAVKLAISADSKRQLKSVFDVYAAPEEYTFSKTVVPLRLARLGGENLLSRSQAKRALARVERFKTVLFDFSEVDSVGQAFADEIFRVFANAHPDVELIPAHFNETVKRMLLHVGVRADRLLQPDRET